ncbi:MAG: SH3 domain-containing protein [Clostridia bacterium]|nr:SH3 domain-containing protein [Clostridia bacterium]
MRKNLFALLFILAFSVFIMAGCGRLSVSDKESGDDEIVTEETETSTSEDTKTEKPTPEASESATPEATPTPEINSPTPTPIPEIRAAFRGHRPYQVDFTKDLITVSHDFNADGQMDTLECQPVEGDNGGFFSDCTLRINGVELPKSIAPKSEAYDGLVTLGILDIDTSDAYTEFFIQDGFLLDRCTTYIYRFDGKAFSLFLKYQGGIQGFSGDNRLYYWGGNLVEMPQEPFDENLVLRYYDVTSKAEVETDQIVGKTLSLKFENIIYKTKDDIIQGAPMEWDQILKETEATRVGILKPGQEFVVVEKGEADNVRIKTTDGLEGWLGGNHMVWD